MKPSAPSAVAKPPSKLSNSSRGWLKGWLWAPAAEHLLTQLILRSLLSLGSKLWHCASLALSRQSLARVESEAKSQYQFGPRWWTKESKVRRPMYALIGPPKNIRLKPLRKSAKSHMRVSERHTAPYSETHIRKPLRGVAWDLKPILNLCTRSSHISRSPSGRGSNYGSSGQDTPTITGLLEGNPSASELSVFTASFWLDSTSVVKNATPPTVRIIVFPTDASATPRNR